MKQINMRTEELVAEPIPNLVDSAAHPKADGWMLRFIREQATRWLVLLAVCELLLLTASLWISMHLRFWDDPKSLVEFSFLLPVRALVFGGMIVLAMAALGMYQPRMREGWFGMLARQTIGFSLGSAGLAVVYYAIPQLHVGRGVAGLALLIALLMIASFRTLFMRLVDVDVLKRRVLVLGTGRRAALVTQRMRRRVDRRGFNLVGFLPIDGEPYVVPAERILSAGDGLASYARKMQIAEIVVGPDDRRGRLPMEELLECKQLGISVTDLATFFERELGSVNLGLTEPSWLVFSQGFDASPMRRVSKRGFDMLTASIVLLLSWPLMLITALAIRLESGARAPVLYRQERVGAHGKTFHLIKFRSMRTDAEKDGVARWATKGDARVTIVGRIIRKTRLDELPQLWNVLRGDMSFIGPRPERPQFVNQLSQKIRYYQLRHCVKPGLAGWAQLNYPYGASEEDAAEKLTYDLFYVKNHDLLLDLFILIQTVEIVLFGRGAR
ncbi:MAG: TIGR03013 family XrtA/PEP-CTERM system glycosyltransferase [Dokdonella sp.]